MSFLYTLCWASCRGDSPLPQPLHPPVQSPPTLTVWHGHHSLRVRRFQAIRTSSAVLVKGILWLNRQCYLMGMVFGFAELGGTIGLFPSAVPSGLRLTLELRLVFEPKILLF